MMGMEDLFKAALGDFPDGDISRNGLAAKALVRSGLAVLLIEPGGKKPVCTLTTRQTAVADEKARVAAREHGTKNWAEVRHDCGVYHAITDTKDLAKPRVKEWLANGCNLAVVPHLSDTHVIVVDLDTREERRGFCEDWAAGDPEFTGEPPMTVTSPGVLTAELDGTEIWTHKDGGHYWFTVPAVPVLDDDGNPVVDDDGKPVTERMELPERPGKLKGASGWVAYYGSGYVLVPPSVRSEGPYRLTGATVEAPAWLLDAIRAAGTTGSATDLKERIRAGETDQGIDAWSAATSWADLLGAYGWTPTGSLDSCGCPTWTRPGSPAHSKSATAHEVGCPQYVTDTGHGPIHAWSDAVSWGGKTTVTKLTFLAHEGYSGNMGAAMEYIGVTPQTAARDHSELDFDVDDELTDPTAEGEALPKGDQGEDEDAPDSWRPRDLSAILNGTVPRVEPTLLPRSDGHALLYPGKVHSMHGESESGKSLILMGEAVRIMKAGGDVLWLTFDSDEEEDVSRALRFGATPEEITAHLHYIRPEVAPGEARESFRAMLQHTYTLAVIDGVVDAMGLITSGAKGDPNEVFSLFFRILPKRLARYTGAATVMVDHVTKDAESRGRFAIGAQAKMAAITGAAYLVEPDKENAPMGGSVGSVILRVGKDRPKEVRRYCGPRRARDRTQEAARVTFDDTGEFTIMTVDPAETDPYILSDGDSKDGRGPTVDIPFGIMQAISEFLEARPEGMAKKDVEAGVTGNAGRKRLAMKELVRLHYVSETTVGTSKILTLLVPYYTEYGDCDADVSQDADAA